MSWDWGLFMSALDPGSVLGTIIFGVLIGGLFEWRLGNGEASVSLLIVGIGFTIVIGVAAELSGGNVERLAARALLWTLLCVTMPLARRGRQRFELWRLRGGQ